MAADASRGLCDNSSVREEGFRASSATAWFPAGVGLFVYLSVGVADRERRERERALSLTRQSDREKIRRGVVLKRMGKGSK